MISSVCAQMDASWPPGLLKQHNFSHALVSDYVSAEWHWAETELKE